MVPIAHRSNDRRQWRPILLGTSAVGSGLVGGVLFAFSSFVMPALHRIPASEGISAMQSINRQAPTFAFMSLVGVTTVASVGLGAHAVIDRHEPGAGWTGIGAVAHLIATAITGGFNVPRHDRLATVDATTSSGAEYWSTFLSEWVVGNHARTTACIVATAACTVAIHQTATGQQCPVRATIRVTGNPLPRSPPSRRRTHSLISSAESHADQTPRADSFESAISTHTYEERP